MQELRKHVQRLQMGRRGIPGVENIVNRIIGSVNKSGRKSIDRRNTSTYIQANAPSIERYDRQHMLHIHGLRPVFPIDDARCTSLPLCSATKCSSQSYNTLLAAGCS